MTKAVFSQLTIAEQSSMSKFRLQPITETKAKAKAKAKGLYLFF